MKIQLTAFSAAVALAALASTAMAAEPVTAKLTTALTAPKKVVAGGAVFVCEGDTCVAPNPTSGSADPGACRELVRAAGAVSTFGTAAKPFSAERLARCNTWAHK